MPLPLLLLSLAHAAEEGLPALPEGDFAVNRDYSAYVLSQFADSLGVEAELSNLDVDARSASVLHREDAGLMRQPLSEGKQNAIALKGRDQCGEIGAAWWPRNLVVRLAERRDKAEAGDGLVVVENNPKVGTVAELRAGDTVEQRTVRYNGRLVSESVTLSSTRDIVLRSADGRFTVCSK